MAIELDAVRAAATRAADEGADERIPIALSSEFEVERWFGTEVLDHSKTSIVLDRAADGLPLLMDHSVRDQVGVIEDVELGSDRILRGLMRFSASARGQEIRQDVLDGIRRNASIGYQIHEVTIEGLDTDHETWRATKWEPLEGSIVAIPADPTVGANRGADEGAAYPVRFLSPHSPAPKGQERTTVDPENTTAAPAGAATVAPAARAGEDLAVLTTRTAEIVELCSTHGIAERAGAFIREGKTRAQVAEIILAETRENVQAMTTPAVTLSDKEQKRYSVARAIAAAAERALGESNPMDDSFEREVSDEIEKRMPKGYERRGGLFVPTNVRAGLDAKTATKGIEQVFDQPGTFIEKLRARMRTMQLGLSTLSGLTGTVNFPKQTAAGSFSWVGENPGVDVADSNLLLALVALAPKTGQSTTSFSRQLLRMQNSGVDTENLVRDDIAKEHALGIDLAVINGAGGNALTGILNTAGIGSVAIGANGGVPTYEHLVDLETAIADANADIGEMGYLSTPGIRGRLKKTAELANTAALPVWRGDEANGYRALASKQVPSTLTKGTSVGNCHAIAFGVWSQAILGEWGALELVVDPFRLKKQGMIEITSFQMLGLAVRYAEAFAAILDAKTAP